MSTLDIDFANTNPSVRLKAALSAGLNPSLRDLDALIDRCTVEPDFQVREMLTWALIRLPAEIVVPRLVAELASHEAQARSQALHTLSKIRDISTWPAVSARLDDEDQDVVRTAWYAAVALVPESERGWLARKFAEHLGRGEREIQLSLSRALVALGEDTITPVIAAAAEHSDEAVRQHAAATKRLIHDPNSGFTHSLNQARREVAMGRTKSTKG
ncbi:HEAT repeat domain-containing protein [Neorhizobium sp. DT-125]|uniref:HEAT repeat domain-containing protein n=1 Tax=Neorhizobium sp. DT-125 TaxID=3396163 RepID=UPI003F19C4F0